MQVVVHDAPFLVGTMLGLKPSLQRFAFLILIGILALGVIPFCLSWCFEGIARKDFGKALKPGLAAYLTYFLSMILKLAVCCFCLYIVIDNMGN